MTMDVYAPLAMLLPSRFEKYENLYEIDLQSESRNANNFGQGLARQRHRESGLKKLMTINLLKRLESSVFAFRLSLSKLIDINQNTLDVIEKFLAGDKKAKIQAETNTYVINYLDDDEEDFTLTKTSSGKQINIDLNDLDVLTWKGCIENDIGILREIYAEMRKVKPDEDKKLGELKAIINDKIAHPLNENNKKILIFSAFADTADYLYDELSSYMFEKYGLYTAKVAGGNNNKSNIGGRSDTDRLLTLFSPMSKQRDLTLRTDKGEIDILIGTDCISEGQNLQDCDICINYDMAF